MLNIFNLKYDWYEFIKKKKNYTRTYRVYNGMNRVGK